MIVAFPCVLVFAWIGGMKFTLLEAQGIEPLINTSPLMAWMYQVWDVQTTSNLIGVFDLIAASLLIIAIWMPRLVVPAIALSASVFLTTQTFLFTWPSALSSDTILTTGGHFLIKDLWYIACLLLYWQSLRKQVR